MIVVAPVFLAALAALLGPHSSLPCAGSGAGKGRSAVA
jgi:hypothetical protein